MSKKGFFFFFCLYLGFAAVFWENVGDGAARLIRENRSFCALQVQICGRT